jgi:hypothetical protein
MPPNAFYLVARKGPVAGQTFPLTTEIVTLGRDTLTDIVLNHDEVSRFHAKLARTAAGFTLQDMGSTNGTFVDGVRLGGEAVLLKPGQTIMLGNSVALSYEPTAAEPSLATPFPAAGAAPSLEEPAISPAAGEPFARPDLPPPAMVLPPAVPEPEAPISFPSFASPEAGPPAGGHAVLRPPQAEMGRPDWAPAIAPARRNTVTFVLTVVAVVAFFLCLIAVMVALLFGSVFRW